MTLELYHSLYSTCSQKVRIALFEKALPWTSRIVDLSRNEHLTPEYKALNPNGVIPTLVDDGRPVIESSAILEYLDDRFPERPLRPDDIYERAKLRAWICFINEVPTAYIRYPTFHAVVPLLVAGMSEPERLANADARGTRRYLYRRTQKTGLSDTDMVDALDALRQTVLKVDDALGRGDWIIGAQFSQAEAAIIPTFDRMEDLGMAPLWADRPRVIDWWRRIQARPSYASAYPTGSRVSSAFPTVAERSHELLDALCRRVGRAALAG